MIRVRLDLKALLDDLSGTVRFVRHGAKASHRAASDRLFVAATWDEKKCPIPFTGR
jgi:hypothetical protein